MKLDEGCKLVGMVHLGPLPGSPGWRGDLRAIREAALRDADTLLAGGCDALLVENMGDLPYLRGRVYPETVAAAAVVGQAVVSLGAPVGVQLLAAAWRETLGLAVAIGASFMRVEAFVYGHVADEGWLDANAAELVRRRAELGAEVAIWADIRKKHAAHAATADLDLGQLAKGAAFCAADAVIVTGTETGAPTAVADVRAARSGGLPVVVGSGVGVDDAAELAGEADALIVGSSLKVGGDWRAPVELARVRALRAALGG